MVKMKDLKDQTETPYPRPILWCSICSGTYSAHSGDYFVVNPEHVFMCCNIPMKLVIKRVIFEEVNE